MKSTLLIAAMFMASTMAHAQLKVDSVGHVGIGSTSTTSLLSVGGSESGYIAAFKPSTGNGVFVKDAPIGINIQCNKASGLGNGRQSIGLNVEPQNVSSLQASYGVLAGGSPTNRLSVGVAGYLMPNQQGYIANYAGVFGSSTDNLTISHTGVFAGYFRGDVRVTGNIFGTVMTPIQPGIIDGEFEPIPGDESGSVCGQLSQLNAVQVYDNSQPDPSQTTTSPLHYALDVKSLKEQFPELVTEDIDGNVSINYIEMIPLLVQSVKELSSMIEEMGGMPSKAKNMGGTTGVESAEQTELLSLAQNKPNPFTTSTSIEVAVPQSVRSATMFIYDMSGKQVRQIDIRERGKVSVAVTAEGLSAGMYLYSLIADGKVVSTKRMILTK